MSKNAEETSHLAAGDGLAAPESRHTPGPLEVRIDSTCSGAWPVIFQRCIDPKTNEEWERELGQTETAYVEKSHRARDNGKYGGYDEAPGRFKPAKDCDEALANARLWAAAPDLLAMVQRYASECAECGGEPTDDGAPCPECADIRAAIAKAAGAAS
jgi:hypothetical protein